MNINTHLDENTASASIARSARQWRSTPPNVELTTTTYRALRKLADYNEQSLNATIFELAHATLSGMLGSPQHVYLPTPFQVVEGRVGAHKTFNFSHSDLEPLELTRTEFRALTDLLNVRITMPKVRQFMTAIGGVTVDVKRNRQGVRLMTNQKRLNLSRVEAEALTDGLDRIQAHLAADL